MQRPYVEALNEGWKIHAKVIGWDDDLIFIEYPSKVTSQMNKDAMDRVGWIHKNDAKRIRRADSIFASTEDDHDWHEREDAKITYRADPWLVLGQDKHGH